MFPYTSKVEVQTFNEMISKKILAFSSSRVGNSDYLEIAIPFIKKLIGSKARNIAFIPFASVGKDNEEYTFRVKEALKNLPVNIETVLPKKAKLILEKTDGIMVGGGNTFKLLHDLYKLNLLDIIRNKVNAGAPYISWSAGSNIVGKTIGTTNDMPIIKPKSFDALNLFPFQINPHYHKQQIKDFNGETRDQRLEEFLKINPGIPIVCLPEGTGLQLLEGKLKFVGNTSGVLFYKGNASSITRKEINSKTPLSYLL